MIRLALPAKTLLLLELPEGGKGMKWGAVEGKLRLKVELVKRSAEDAIWQDCTRCAKPQC